MAMEPCTSGRLRWELGKRQPRPGGGDVSVVREIDFDGSKTMKNHSMSSRTDVHASSYNLVDVERDRLRYRPFSISPSAHRIPRASGARRTARWGKGAGERPLCITMFSPSTTRNIAAAGLRSHGKSAN